MLYVNVYEMQQCYGGPEEGGWYYDSWTPVLSKETRRDEYGDIIGERKFISIPCKRKRAANRVARRLEKEFGFDMKSYTSVLQRGENYQVRIESQAAQAHDNYYPYE